MPSGSNPGKDQSAIGNRQSTMVPNRQSAILHSIYEQLFTWCSQHDFAGHDPFDALNSRLFQATPLNKLRSVRLVWTQVVKRSPADLRSVTRVPHERNSKGLALFALAQLARHRQLQTKESETQTRNILAELHRYED